MRVLRTYRAWVRDSAPLVGEPTAIETRAQQLAGELSQVCLSIVPTASLPSAEMDQPNLLSFWDSPLLKHAEIYLFGSVRVTWTGPLRWLEQCGYPHELFTAQTPKHTVRTSSGREDLLAR